MDRGYDLISSDPVQGVQMKRHLKGQIRGLCRALLSFVSHSNCIADLGDGSNGELDCSDEQKQIS